MNEELKVVISAEIDDLKKGVKEAQAEISKFSKNGASGFEQFNTAVSAMGEKSAAVLKGAAAAVAGVGAALLALGPATAEYREGQAKLNAAFEDAGSSAETAKGVYNDLYRVLGDGDVAVEAAGHLAKLTTEEQALSEWTNICQGVYATFGDSLPIESLTEAANETAKTGELTGALADALNWAGVAEDDFQASLEACNTEAEREALIRETLNGLYEGAAETYEGNAASILAQNEAQAKMAESTARLGEAMEPVNTMLMELGAEILADLAPYVEDFAAKYLPQIKEALSDVGEKIGKVISWIADNWNMISTIAGIVLAIAAAIVVLNAGLTVYNTVMAITAVVSAPIVGIIALIVAAIVALGVAIVAVIKNWDEIQAKIKEVWKNVKEWVSDMVAKVKEKFEEMKKNISEKVEAAKKVITEKFNAIKDIMSTIMEAAKKTVNEKLTNIKNAYNEHGGGIKGIVSAAMEAIKGYYTAGYTFINNLTNGKLNEMVNAIKSKLENAKNTISTILDNIKSKFTSIWDNCKTVVSNAIEKIKSIMNFKWELPKLKLPHFSISGKFSLDPPSVPKISISWYKLGGIFDKPTLFGYGNGMLGGLGEDGAEAIVPLEKNTQWLDRIAERLSARDSNIPIVLQVDGKTFAETSIKTINQLTRQTGSLKLALV